MHSFRGFSRSDAGYVAGLLEPSTELSAIKSDSFQTFFRADDSPSHGSLPQNIQ